MIFQTLVPGASSCLVFLFLEFLSASTSAQWQSLNGGVNHFVGCFEVNPDSSRLFVGGAFAYALDDSLRVNNVAAWDGTSWSVEGTGGGSGDTMIYGNSNPVYSLVHYHDTLFTGYLGLAWQNHQGWDYGAYLVEDTWHGLPTSNGWLDFAEVNGRLFMGGAASELGGQSSPGLVELIGGLPTPLPNVPFDPWAKINAYAYWHSAYYFGGVTNNELGSRNIVSFDGVGQWEPLGNGIGGNHLRSIVGYGDSLYVGGFFLPGPNVQSKHLQIWDGAAWHPFFPQVEFVSQVFEMEVYEGALWICGNFQFSPDGPVYAILRYDGHNLCAIGGPCPSGDNGGIAFFQNELYMAVGYGFPGLEYQWIARLPLEGLVPDECVEVTTGISTETGRGNAIGLYPNPALDQLTITGLGGVDGGIVEVLDVLGKRVLAPFAITAASKDLDLGSLSAGSYLLRITSIHGTSLKRFAKR